jgi:hypothetical protein
VFSPDGGKCEADAMSDPRNPSDYPSTDLISMGFLMTPKVAALTQNTRKASHPDWSLRQCGRSYLENP